MLKLNDGRKEMYQWDIGRIATVDVECDFVHFSNLKYGGSLPVEVKNGEVAIPNKLLTSGEPIYCWAFVADENGNYTKQEQTLNVNKRAKPSDYVYTETETLTWKSLDKRITELEKGGTGGSGDMQKSVYDPNNNAKDIYKYADDVSNLAVTNHASSNTAHSDIRDIITVLTDRLNALADSDDKTLDQLSEIVAYIKSNKSLIDAITTEKVSVSDIIDNLTTNNANKPLSAAQGVAIKALIDAIIIPDRLPNPNALTFSGAVTGSYDGSAPVSVEIPSGGDNGGEWELVADVTMEKDVQQIDIALSKSCKRVWVAVTPYGSTRNSGKSDFYIYVGDKDYKNMVGNTNRVNADFNSASMIWNFQSLYAEVSGGVIHMIRGYQTSATFHNGWGTPANYMASDLREFFGSTLLDKIETVRLQMWGVYFGAGTRVIVRGA